MDEGLKKQIEIKINEVVTKKDLELSTKIANQVESYRDYLQQMFRRFLLFLGFALAVGSALLFLHRKYF